MEIPRKKTTGWPEESWKEKWEGEGKDVRRKERVKKAWLGERRQEAGKGMVARKGK